MARQNIVSAHLPDELADWVEAQDQSVSSLINEALRKLRERRIEK